jgi:hypothetical protein
LLGTTIARWTGRGRLQDLTESVKEILRVEGKKSRVFVLGNSMIVRGVEPSSVAGLLSGLPGVAWLAIGDSSDSVKGLAAEIGRLARGYVKPGGRFVIRAESTDDRVKASDLAGAATSAVLDAVRGARVSESAPKTTFRVAFDKGDGAAGVEVCEGPGGSAMGSEIANCLVSGGKHSSAMAWAAMLSGYSVRLVHAKVSPESVTAVAKLYAELSHRVDPRKIELVVLEGGARALSDWSARAKGHVFVGLHAGCHDGARSVARSAAAPLFLLPEESFDSTFSSLGLRQFEGREKLSRGKRGPARASGFGRVRADVHGVLDGLRLSSR